MEYNYHVDENDNVIGKTTRDDIINKRVLHRGAGVIVFNSKGEIMIHSRPKDKKFNPGTYSMIFGGGVIYGETYEEAAERELKEEAGIESKIKFEVYPLFESKTNHHFAKIYSCVWGGEFNFDKESVLNPHFITMDKIKEMLKTEKFAEDDVYFFNEFLKKHSKAD